MDQDRVEWEKIGYKNHHGLNIPLFSLKSKDSTGIGEFTDLIPLLQFCKEVSFDTIQLLPLNDTGIESSPYSAISAFALNPIHLGLSFLKKQDEISELQPLLKKLKTFNDSKIVDYVSVRFYKNEFLKIYHNYMNEEIKNSAVYKKFVNENSWLEPFALFKTLSILENWKSFEEFPQAWQNPNPNTFKKLLTNYRDEVDFHIFVQYLCFSQMEEVKKIAHENRILLMGDIPILISRNSADVWFRRNLFNLNFSAGAPPDFYAQEGQNWGSPIYNWEEMEKENFTWWKERLKVASDLFDLYRIDHIIGFFRIFAIPPYKTGREGHYIPENEQQAEALGEKILKMMLEEKKLLPIGEDLGNVPYFVRSIMQKLLIPGTKVMRWERAWNEDKRFIKGKDYPPLSLTTVSTHDSETVPLWWNNNSQEAIDYAKSENIDYQNKITNKEQLHILKTSHATSSLFHINLLQEYLFLIPGYTSSILEDERINVPGTVSDKNWTYKCIKTVEEIVNNQELKNILKELTT